MEIAEEAAAAVAVRGFNGATSDGAVDGVATGCGGTGFGLRTLCGGLPLAASAVDMELSTSNLAASW